MGNRILNNDTYIYNVKLLHFIIKYLNYESFKLCLNMYAEKYKEQTAADP